MATPAFRAERLAIPEVVLITPQRVGDSRGFFSESWNEERFAAAGVAGHFIQDNHSLSEKRGTLRGLHCQIAPSAQGKLVRVLRGAIWDVAVDLRRNSPTYGQHVAAVLSAENWSQLWIPAGFLHGFCTIEPNTEVMYKVTGGYYDPQAERGVIWNDPDLAIPWPLDGEPLLSAKDHLLPRLRDLGSVEF